MCTCLAEVPMEGWLSRPSWGNTPCGRRWSWKSGSCIWTGRCTGSGTPQCRWPWTGRCPWRGGRSRVGPGTRSWPAHWRTHSLGSRCLGRRVGSHSAQIVSFPHSNGKSWRCYRRWQICKRTIMIIGLFLCNECLQIIKNSSRQNITKCKTYWCSLTF